MVSFSANKMLPKVLRFAAVIIGITVKSFSSLPTSTIRPGIVFGGSTETGSTPIELELPKSEKEIDSIFIKDWLGKQDKLLKERELKFIKSFSEKEILDEHFPELLFEMRNLSSLGSVIKEICDRSVIEMQRKSFYSKSKKIYQERLFRLMKDFYDFNSVLEIKLPEYEKRFECIQKHQQNTLKLKQKIETLQANLTKANLTKSNQIVAERKRLKDELRARDSELQRIKDELAEKCRILHEKEQEMEKAKKEQSKQQNLNNIQTATITTTTSITATTMTKSMIKWRSQMMIVLGTIIGAFCISLLFGKSASSSESSLSLSSTSQETQSKNELFLFFTLSLIVLFVVAIFCCYRRKNQREKVRKIKARGAKKRLAKTCSAAANADAATASTASTASASTTTTAAAAAAASMSTPTSNIRDTKSGNSPNLSIQNDSLLDSKSRASSLVVNQASSTTAGASWPSASSNDRAKTSTPKICPQVHSSRDHSILTLSKTNVERGGGSGGHLETSSKSKIFLAKKSNMPIYDNDDINSIKKAKSEIGKIRPQPITNPKVRTGGGASSLSFAQISNVTSALDSPIPIRNKLMAPDSKYRVSSTTPKPKIFSSKR